MLSAPAKNSDIFLGRIVKPFGIRGELKFVTSDDFWDDVFDSEALLLRRQTDDGWTREPVNIERVRAHGNHWVLKLKNVDDRNGAEEEVGGELVIDAGSLDVPLPEYELPYYLVGSVVKTEDGTRLGELTSVMFSSAHRVYEVTDGDRTLLIPEVPEFIVARDAENGEVTVRPIPGLLDD